MSENDWIRLWEIVLTTGFGCFFLLVLVIIPLGARDIARMFRSLDEESE